jgi:peptide/nickel transport system ATP-binding protein
MTAAGSPAVELAGVGRRFRRGRVSLTRAAGHVDALVGVTLSIPAGSRFGIVGESGSGKTTLMRLIAALDRPTSGRISVLGTDITGLPESGLTFLRRSLQIVFQDPMGSLDPRMRVGSIVAEPLQVQRHPDVTGAVVRALEQVGLDAAAARRYPHQFSGGQRQRISIARAIAPEPAILIADEAVSALDVTIRAQILELIEDLAIRRRLTLIFVSHDLSVIRRVCDQVAVLRAGRLVESGQTEQVYASPQDAYTRQLLEAVPTLERSLHRARERSAQDR